MLGAHSTADFAKPACGQVERAMIRQSDKKPGIIEYLKSPPTRQRLVELIGAMGLTVRHLLRRRAPLITLWLPFQPYSLKALLRPDFEHPSF